MRPRKGESEEDRQARRELDGQRLVGISRKWAEMDTIRCRRRHALLPGEEYQTFVAAAHQQRSGAEAALKAAGYTVGKRAIELVRQGITDELKVVADIRAQPDRGAFAGPEPQESIFE